MEEEEGGALRPSLLHNRLSLGASWVQGFLEGGMLTFLSIHLLTLGYDEMQVGGLMAALFLGVVLFQTPSAWLADRFGRLRVLAAFHGVLLLGLVCLPFCSGPVAVGGWLFSRRRLLRGPVSARPGAVGRAHAAGRARPRQRLVSGL